MRPLLDLELPLLKDEKNDSLSMDRLERCLDKNHFLNYPHEITYSYNSRGFRDAEWPTDAELDQAIWCVGDSFTVGIGSPLEHTWVNLLQQKTGTRCINISMDGASNNWIARRTANIAREIAPRAIVVQWSYLHRRETTLFQAYGQVWHDFYNSIRDSTWPEGCAFENVQHLPPHIQAEISMHTPPVVDDFCRQRHYSKSTTDEDIRNTVEVWKLLNAFVDHSKTKIIHSAIPEFCPKVDLEKFTAQAPDAFIAVQQLDWARDHHHYDIVSARKFVDQVVELL